MSLEAEIHGQLGPGRIEAQNLFGSDPVWFEILLVTVRFSPSIQMFRFGLVDPWLKLNVFESGRSNENTS